MKGIRLILALTGIFIIYSAYVVALFSGGDECVSGYVHEEVAMTNAESWILWGFIIVAGFFAINLSITNIIINAKKKSINP